MLKGLSPRKASGLDDLPARFIPDGAEGIAYPISYINNLSLKTGVVPDEMKTARVIPLYKKNSKLESGNYRPVSILSTLSKILEKAVHIQLQTNNQSTNKTSIAPISSAERVRGAQILSVIICHNRGQIRFVDREPGCFVLALRIGTGGAFHKTGPDIEKALDPVLVFIQ